MTLIDNIVCVICVLDYKLTVAFCQDDSLYIKSLFIVYKGLKI